MTTLADKAILLGADNRPPMLEKDMYDSWKSIIELYMMNRQHGIMILESIENGPLIWPSVVENKVTRPKKYSELSVTEAIQADCDVKATNIILQYSHQRDLHTTNVDQLHAYLGQHEFYANESLQYGSPYQSQQYSHTQLSTHISITYPSNDFQSSVHHNVYTPSSSIPQVEYPPSVNQQPDFSQPDSGLIVLMFQKGDDPIDAINHMLSFLTAIVTSRYPPTNNKLRNSSNPRQQATINNKRVTIQPIQGRHTSLAAGTSRTYTSRASGNNSGKQRTVICYNCKGEDDLAEVHNQDNVTHNLINQAVQAMPLSEQSNIVNQSEIEITSDSNIIPYSQYINLDNKSVNETLTAELERYKDQVRILKDTHNVDLKSNDIVSDSCAQSVEIDNLKQTLLEHLKEKESLKQTVTLFKNDFQKEESRNIDREIALEKHIKELNNKAQQLEPKLYDGNVLQKTNAIVIRNSKETLMLAEESRSKMLLKQKDPMMPEKKVNTKPVDYTVLNQLSQDFETRFVPQTELSAEQVFWFQNLVVQIVLWYLDSGCSKHMTEDRSQLTNFVDKFLGTVKFGNDHVEKIMVYGDYQIGNVTISRVYFVEGLGHNLFSVGQFCDSDLEVAFRQHTCFVDILGPSDTPLCYLCTCEQCGNILIHGTCLKCNSGAGNSFPYDSIPESFNEVQIIPNPPPQSHFNIYLCQICENNSHYGYECSQRVPLVYEPKPCYNQNFGDNTYSHESPSVTPQIDHHCCYKSGDSLNDFFCHHSTYEFCGNGAHDGYNCPLQVPFIQTLPSFPQQYPCCEDYRGPHETFQFNPFVNIQNEPDNHELFISKLIQQKLQNEYAQPFSTIAITFDLPTVEPEDSLRMGDEHLDTISATKSDEFIKSSVENLIPSPSESTDLSDSECDVSACDDFTTFSNLLFDADDDLSSSDDESFSNKDISKKIYSNPLFDEEIISIKIDPHHFNAESDLRESLLNYDSSIISSSSKIDSLLDEFAGELILLKINPPGIDETDCDAEEEIRLINCCMITHLLDSDSFMEKFDLSFTPDDSMPSGIEEDDYDSERDMLIFEELLSNNSLPLPENESFHFDIPSSSRPPAKPPDDSGILTVKVVDDLSELYVPLPKL
nr:hypothetical protein [Tanacetum cinerariifolium]